MNTPMTNEDYYVEERVLRRIPLEILLVSLAMTVCASLFFSLRTGFFVLAGGIFSALGFIWLRQALSKILLQSRPKALRSGVAFYVLRLLLIIAVFSIIIFFFSRMILAFAAGFSAIILVFLAEAAAALARTRQWKG